MATVSKGRTFVSGETVTPAKLNELVDNATVTSIVDADVSASAAIALSKLATGALPTAITTTTGNIVDASVTQAKLASGVAGNGPAFRATTNTPTTVATSSQAKVTLDAEIFDTDNCFASSRFTPNVAGYYYITGAIYYFPTAATDVLAILRKNNTSEVAYGVRSANANTYSSIASDLIYFNGTTDYIELFAFHASGSNRTVAADSRLTYMSGFLARAA